MTYRVELFGNALIQFHEMPHEARDAFITRAAQLADAPWDGVRLLFPGVHDAFREAVFGPDGEGILRFQLKEDERLLIFFAVLWAG